MNKKIILISIIFAFLIALIPLRADWSFDKSLGTVWLVLSYLRLLSIWITAAQFFIGMNIAVMAVMFRGDIVPLLAVVPGETYNNAPRVINYISVMSAIKWWEM